MNLLYKILFLLAILALFSHCKRDENNGLVVIAGTVTDAFTGEAVANVSVNILIKGIVDGVFNNNFQDVAQDVTSTNGEYRLEFEKGTPTTYRFEVDGSGSTFCSKTRIQMTIQPTTIMT